MAAALIKTKTPQARGPVRDPLSRPDRQTAVGGLMARRRIAP